MNAQFDRIFLLINQKRYPLAEQEVRKVIATNSNNGDLFALLAICLMMQDQTDEALEAAQHGLGLSPYSAYCHYTVGKVFWEQNKLVKALDHIGQALEIEPNDEDYLYALAAIRFQQERYEESLKIVNHLLMINAESVNAINLRARCLVALNQKQEGVEFFDESLNRDPNNAYTHANKGWALLDTEQNQEALASFKTALQIDPELDFAREGLVEALKRENAVYRVYLAIYNGARDGWSPFVWIVVLGLSFIFWKVMLAIIVIFYFFFFWFSDAIFNTLLRFNEYGRYALSDEQIQTSNIGLSVFSTVILVITLGWSMQGGSLYLAAWLTFGLLLPLIFTLSLEHPSHRIKAGTYTFCMLAIGTVGAILNNNTPETAQGFLGIFILMALGFFWFITAVEKQG